MKKMPNERKTENQKKRYKRKINFEEKVHPDEGNRFYTFLNMLYKIKIKS